MGQAASGRSPRATSRGASRATNEKLVNSECNANIDMNSNNINNKQSYSHPRIHHSSTNNGDGGEGSVVDIEAMDIGLNLSASDHALDLGSSGSGQDFELNMEGHGSAHHLRKHGSFSSVGSWNGRHKRFPSVGSDEWFQEDLDFLDASESDTHHHVHADHPQSEGDLLNNTAAVAVAGDASVSAARRLGGGQQQQKQQKLHPGYERCRAGSLITRQTSLSVTGGVGLGTNELLLVPQAYHYAPPGNPSGIMNAAAGGASAGSSVGVSRSAYGESSSKDSRSGIALLLSLLPRPKAPPPQYILESPLSAQLLWHATAGQRPPQPHAVRELIYQLWSKNVRESQIRQTTTGGCSSSSSLSVSKSTAAGDFQSEQPPSQQVFSEYTLDVAAAADDDVSDAQPRRVMLDNPNNSSSNSAGRGQCTRTSRGAREALQLFAGPGLHSSTVSKSFHMAVMPSSSSSSSSSGANGSTGGPHNISSSRSRRRHHSSDGGVAPVSSLVLTMNLQVPKYRVLRRLHSNGDGGVYCGGCDEPPGDCTGCGSDMVGLGLQPLYHAEFLVVVALGEGLATITLGVWRRYSDFARLAKRLQAHCVEIQDREAFSNTLVSWQCVEARRRWGRCLEADYLGLKCHLLERFLHDLLFESGDPSDIAGFLGLDAASLQSDPTLHSLMPVPIPTAAVAVASQQQQ